MSPVVLFSEWSVEWSELDRVSTAAEPAGDSDRSSEVTSSLCWVLFGGVGFVCHTLAGQKSR